MSVSANGAPSAILVPHDYRQLFGSERRLGKHSKPVGPAHPADIVTITIVLRRRSDGPALPDNDYWERTHPSQRRYLTVEAFTPLYGASQDDLDAVVAFASGAGLTIAQAHAGRRSVTVSGTVAQINRALAIDLRQYDSPLPDRRKQRSPDKARQIHHGYEGHVHVPNSLAAIVVAIFGLDNRKIAKRFIDPLPVGIKTVPQVCQLYGWPIKKIPGQTIGIIGTEFAIEDVNLYFENLNKSVYEAGFFVEGPQSGIAPAQPPADAVTGAFVAPSEALGTLVIVGGALSNESDGETNMDVSIVGTIAQGATIAVYCSDGSSSGYFNATATAFIPDAGQPVPYIVSSSYGYAGYGDDAEGLYYVGVTPMEIAGMSSLFEDAAMHGIAFCAASGDSGVGSGIPQDEDGKRHVTYPASDPSVLACGGTAIGNIDGLSFDEYLWSDYGGVTGGGVSAFFNDNNDYITFRRPGYQANTGIPVSLNDGTIGRGVPDVAANAGAVGYPMYWDGAGVKEAGTSAATPLIAGLLAQLNAAVGYNVGFLNPTLYAGNGKLCRKIISTPAANAIGNSFLIEGYDNTLTVATQGYPGTTTGWDACTGWGVFEWPALLKEFRPGGAFPHVTPIFGWFPPFQAGTREQPPHAP